MGKQGIEIEYDIYKQSRDIYTKYFFLMLHMMIISFSSYLETLVTLVTLSPSHKLTEKHTFTGVQFFLSIYNIYKILDFMLT